MSAIGTNEPELEEGQESEFVRLRNMVKEGHQARSKWRKEMREAYDFVAGHQWSEEDMKVLNEQHRPPVTFNRTAPIIKAVCGLEVNNRQGIVFLPRKLGDSGPDEMRTSAAKWMRDECDAEDEESEAFRDTTICGEGWVESRMDHDEEPQGKFVEERIFPGEMGTNKGACKANYSDARMIYRVRDLDVFDAKDMFPDTAESDVHVAWLGDTATPEDGGEGNKTDYPEETRAGLNSARIGLRKCRVVHVQWWERKPVHLVAQSNDTEPVEMSPEDFKKYSERAMAAGTTFVSTTVQKRFYFEAFLGNAGMLPIGGNKQVTKRPVAAGTFQWRAITGERDTKLNCFYGLVRDMLDPQRWANKWLSQTMHIMNSNAKGGVMAEKDAFVNQREAETDWADPTKIVWVKPGAIANNKIKDRMPPPLPQGLSDMMNFALSSLRDTTGVNLELLGQADREQAASLEAQRRQAALTILATLFDSLRRFRKGQGRTTLHYVEMLPAGTLVRVSEKGTHKYVPFVKDGGSARYDVIVDEAPSSPNQKQAVWAMVMQLLQGGIQLTPPAIIKLLKYSPLPESVVQEVAEAMGLGEGEMNAQQLQQKLMQAEQALKVMEQELTKAMEENKNKENDRSIDLLKLEIDEYKAETQRLAALWSAKVAATQAKQDAAVTPDPDESGESGTTEPTEEIE